MIYRENVQYTLTWHIAPSFIPWLYSTPWHGTHILVTNILLTNNLVTWQFGNQQIDNQQFGKWQFED